MKSKAELNVRLGIGYKSSLDAAKRGAVIIAIDVLRCSSSIVTGLANGAKAVIPAQSVRKARALSKMHGAILAGERRGLKPEGFELGNSPFEFTRKTVQGRTIVLTTTNGTKAILLGRKARNLLVGSLLNLSATAKLASRMAESSRCGITIVTAGKRGKFSLEDFLCAGALSDRFSRRGGELDDGCIAAAHAYREVSSDLGSAVREGLHARYLKSIDLDDDVTYCTQIDLFDIAAVLRKDRVVAVRP